MINPLNSTNEATGAASTDFNGGNKALGKEDFLKLLIAQMRHQDPLKPKDDTAFVAQLAQFSSLEAQASTNKLLELVATQQQGLANNTIVDLVGKNVTVKGNKVSYDGSGIGAATRFTLGAAASEVTVTIREQGGNPGRVINAGAKAAGPNTVQWDGKNNVGVQQPPGAYTIRITAKAPGGASVEVAQEASGTVSSVSFDQGFTNLVLDNGVNAPAADLVRVNK